MAFDLPDDWLLKIRKKLPTMENDPNTREALDRIADTFQDPVALAKLYVEPDCQSVNPADRDEQAEFDNVPRQSIISKVCSFLNGNITEKNGKNQYFVLSDAGMGKTSLLVMLQLVHFAALWPNGSTVKLLKLGRDTIKSIDQIESKRNTILLLDALDEDPTAWGRIKERLEELLSASQKCYRVIITCRTQFFPASEELENEKTGRIIIGSYQCPMIYLSLFNQKQVDAYLKQKYPAPWYDRWRNKEDSRTTKARGIIQTAETLCFRPMLLAHIDDLLEAEKETWNQYTAYEELTNAWLRREVDRLKKTKEEEGWTAEAVTTDQLRDICITIAWHLHSNGKRGISLEELTRLFPSDDAIKPQVNQDNSSVAPSSEFRYLSNEQLDELQGSEFTPLHSDRSALFSGIPDEFVSQIDGQSSPAKQWLVDLKHLNQTFELQDDTIPFERWLNSAINLYKVLPLAKRLENIRNVVLSRYAEEKSRIQNVTENSATLHNVQQLKVGSRSMLNRQADGQFRFSHYSLQEFYVVLGFLSNWAPKKQHSLRWTPQMFSFALAEVIGLHNEQMNGLKEQELFIEDMIDSAEKILDVDKKVKQLFLLLSSRAIRMSKIPWADHDKIVALKYMDRKGKLLPDIKADLSGLDLSGANLSGTNLSFADLSGANLSGTSLSGANLSFAYLSFANLSRAYLSRADLSGADLSRANLSDADLSDADLSGADLFFANLSFADLSNTDFSHAFLGEMFNPDTSIETANIHRAIFSRRSPLTDFTATQQKAGIIILEEFDLRTPEGLEIFSIIRSIRKTRPNITLPHLKDTLMEMLKFESNNSFQETMKRMLNNDTKEHQLMMAMLE